MAVNLSALANLTTTAQAISNLILVTPNSNLGYKPQQTILPDGTVTAQDPPVLFDYEGEQAGLFESDISDHYVEDNTAVQDQIALRPEIITTKGFIGELNDVAPGVLATLQAAANKLTVLNAFTPALSVTALLAYNEAFQAYQLGNLAASAGVSAWGALRGASAPKFVNGVALETQTKQQAAFAKFYGYWRKRTLFTVQTPWALFQNMAIKTLRPIQDAATNTVTEFQVEFKMMRFANTISTSGLSLQFQGRAANQYSLEVNTGASPGTPSNASLLGSNSLVSGINGDAGT